MKEKDSKGKEESEVEVEGKLGDHLKILEEEWGRQYLRGNPTTRVISVSDLVQPRLYLNLGAYTMGAEAGRRP